MIRAIILEDENLARGLLKDYIKDVPFMECVGEFSNPLQAIEILQSGQVDVVFLDIHMPRLSGLELLQQLPQHPFVVFTTAYAEHALEGYEFNTVDYLVKPIPFERFLKACLKVKSLMPSQAKAAVESKVIDLPNGGRTLRIKTDELLYAASEGDYIHLHLVSAKHHLRMSMKRLLEYPIPLVRVHKSFAIHPKRVEIVDSRSVTISGKEIPVGRSYRSVLGKLNLV